MRPTESTLKRLFAHSGNRCPFPNCKATLTFNDTLVGEVCHIKGEKPGAARYDASQTDQERQAYDNLIAMCPTHHTVIDDDEDAYTVQRILKMKTDHEAKTTEMPEADAARVVGAWIENNITNVGQIGGISAQHIQAHTIISHAPSGNALAQQRQLQAIEHIWKTIKALREEFGQLIFVDTIFTRDEIDGFFKNGWIPRMKHIREYADDSVSLRKYEKAGAWEVEQERPFVSHRVWSVYYVLRALYGRVAYLFERSFAKSSYQEWRNDSGTDRCCDRFLLPTSSSKSNRRPSTDYRALLIILKSNFWPKPTCERRLRRTAISIDYSREE